jgi:hypothetical protein
MTYSLTDTNVFKGIGRPYMISKETWSQRLERPTITSDKHRGSDRSTRRVHPEKHNYS